MLRMPRFTVATPRTLAEALALLSQGQGRAVPIAGGTDLLPALKLRLLGPTTLVRLDLLPELQGLVSSADGLELGAMNRLAKLAGSPLVTELAPALAIAAGLVASPQVRNAGTLGGNVMLDTRCRYFNQSHFWRKSLGFCLKAPSSPLSPWGEGHGEGLDRRAGEGTVRCHVVKGGKHCVAALSSDSVPVLVSLGARLELASIRGTRELAVEALFDADGATPHRIEADELLVRVLVPSQAEGHRGAYLKLRPRGSIDFPQLGVAVRLQLAGREIASADVVVGALQSRPIRVGDTAALHGTVPGEAKFDEALAAVAAKAARQCRPLENIPGDSDWRHELVPVFVRRAVRAAAGLP